MMMLLAIAAMVGCSKSEVVDNPNGDGNTPIKLKTFVGKAVKAAETTTDNLTSFQMEAYTTTAAYPGADAPTSFISSAVTTPSSWTYTGPQYWPQSLKVSFFAYAPTTGVTYAAPAAAGWPSFTYKVAETEANQADLIVAQRTSQDATSNGGKVALTFNHALSQILFKAKCASADFTAVVKTIELSGIQNEGTYTFATSETEGTAIEGSWSGVKGAEGYAYLTNGTAAITSAGEAITGTNGALMLMPQTLTGAKLKVVYTVTIGSGDSEQSFDVTKENVELAGTWAPGMKYTYDLTLVSDATAISIVPGVNTWTTGTPTNPSL